MDLKQLYLSGTEEAFSQIYNHYRPKGFKLALGILRCPNLAEHAYQDAMVSLWTKKNKFRGDARFETYAHKVVKNCALMIQRKEIAMAKRKLELQTISEGLVVEPHFEDSIMLRSAIKTLSPGRQKIALFLATNGVTGVRDGAKRLAISIPAYKGRVSRTRRDLRNVINN